MSAHQQNEASHEQDHDESQVGEEDVVEVVEDEGEGFEPMDDEDDNTQYDGEIIIGGPGPGEEDMVMDEEGEQREDNSWGASALHAQEKSVFTVALHPSFPNPPLALSGGEDDAGFLFCPIPNDPSSSTAAVGFNADNFPPTKLTGHTDSVVSTGWSFDGEMVATGGMDGRVRVWRRVKGRRGSAEVQEGGAATVEEWKDWEFLTSLETGSEITWLQWHPKGNVLAAGCEDATVWMWNLPSGNTLTVLSSHTLPSTTGLFPPPLGRQLLTASLDSTLILWDPRTSSPVWKSSIFMPPNSPELDPSEHGITSLAVSPNGQIAAVGSSSGKVKLVNLAKGDTLGNLIGHAEGESIEALVFVDLLGGAAGGGKGVVCVSGATDGKGLVWDVTTGRVRAELQHDEPITSIAAHPSPNLHLVTTASADSTLKTWDIRTGNLIATHSGHVGVVNGVAVAPASAEAGQGQGQVVVSAGDEGVSLIWKV
ncbi:ribosome assembly protein SQT1 [Kwoniella heveanensis CBS 569]|nr:ribosome assembly protein SQT1 [Kwoniella heveanensis CBS 569]